MTLREYLDTRKESIKEFCVRVQIPFKRGHIYFYRKPAKISLRDLAADFRKIQAASNGLVDLDGISAIDGKQIRFTRGRPPAKSRRKKYRGKNKSSKNAA